MEQDLLSTLPGFTDLAVTTITENYTAEKPLVITQETFEGMKSGRPDLVEELHALCYSGIVIVIPPDIPGMVITWDTQEVLSALSEDNIVFIPPTIDCGGVIIAPEAGELLQALRDDWRKNNPTCQKN